MQGIHRSIKRLVEQGRPYDAMHHPDRIRLKIYTGPAISEDGEIYQSKGYYKDRHIVYAVKPDALRRLIRGEYFIPKIEIANVEKLLNIQSRSAYEKEVLNRSTQQSRVGLHHTSPEEEQKGDGVIGQPSMLSNESFNARLFELLAFFRKEVHICTVHPKSGVGDVTTPGDTPTHMLNDVEVTVKHNGALNTDNAFFVPSVSYPREVVRSCPRGSGQKISEYRRNL